MGTRLPLAALLAAAAAALLLLAADAALLSTGDPAVDTVLDASLALLEVDEAALLGAHGRAHASAGWRRRRHSRSRRRRSHRRSRRSRRARRHAASHESARFAAVRSTYAEADPDAHTDEAHEDIGFGTPGEGLPCQEGGYLVPDTYFSCTTHAHVGSTANDIMQSDWFADHFAHPDPNIAHLHESQMIAMSHGWPLHPIDPPLLTSPEMPLVV